MNRSVHSPAEEATRRTWPGFARSCAALAILGSAALWWRTVGSVDHGSSVSYWSARTFLFNAAITLLVLGIAAVVLPGPPYKRRMFAAVAAVFSLGLCLAAVELPALLGLIDYRLVFQTPFRKAWENPRNVLDRELLHVHRPYDRFAGEVKGDLVDWFGIATDRQYRVEVRYDARGFRNALDRDRADVVIIGDSFVEGSLVNYEDIASTRLESLLQCSVLNLGQIGYGPRQQLAALRRFGLQVKPRAVVWVVFEGNDLTHDVLRYEESTADWDRSVRRDHGFSKRSFARNALLWATRPRTAPPVDPSIARKRGGVLRVPGSHAGEWMYFAYEGYPLSEQHAAAMDRGLAAVEEGVRLCREADVQVLLVFAPTKFRVYHDLCAFEPDSAPASWIINDMTDRVRNWADAQGVPMLDLTDPLRDAARAGQLVYFVDDGHWNEGGHDVAARAIARRLQELP